MEGNPLPAVLALDAEPEHERENWRIDDDRTAEWAARILAAAEAEALEVKAQYEDWKARIDGWLEDALTSPKATIARMTAHLEWYAIRCYNDMGRATISLPTRVLTARPVGGNAAIADKATVLAWALDNCVDAIKTTQEVQISLLKPHVTVATVGEGDERERLVITPDGDRVPGMVVTPEEVNVTIKEPKRK